MFIHKITVLASDIEHIASRAFDNRNRARLLGTYVRLRIKASLNRWFHFTQEQFLGFTVIVPDYEIFFSIFRQIFVRHTYYFKVKRTDPEIIDCGGNMGMSVVYFKYLYPESKITVFEPSKEVFDVLQANIQKNKFSDVTIVHAAVSAKAGKVNMYPRGSAACGNTLDQNISRSTHSKIDSTPYVVEAVALSSYITKEIDLLKLDIEGSEGQVVRELVDASKLALVKECVMEYHYYPATPNNNLSEILSLFEVRGWLSQIYYEDVFFPEYQLDLERNYSYSFSIHTVNKK